VGPNSATSGGLSPDEQENPNPNPLSSDPTPGVFVSRPRGAGAGPEFDDQMVWITPPLLFQRMKKSAGGVFESVSDEETFHTMHILAKMEGISVEPAASVAFAGLVKLVRSGKIAPDGGTASPPQVGYPDLRSVSRKPEGSPCAEHAARRGAPQAPSRPLAPIRCGTR